MLTRDSLQNQACGKLKVAAAEKLVMHTSSAQLLNRSLLL